jgi:hypothetical protein
VEVRVEVAAVWCECVICMKWIRRDVGDDNIVIATRS